MKRIKWWKQVDLEVPGFGKGGCRFDLAPVQEAREDQAFFEHVVTAVKASDFSYVLYVQTDELLEQR